MTKVKYFNCRNRQLNDLAIKLNQVTIQINAIESMPVYPLFLAQLKRKQTEFKAEYMNVYQGIR